MPTHDTGLYKISLKNNTKREKATRSMKSCESELKKETRNGKRKTNIWLSKDQRDSTTNIGLHSIKHIFKATEA